MTSQIPPFAALGFPPGSAKVTPFFVLEPPGPKDNVGFHKIGRLTHHAGETPRHKSDGILLVKTFLFYVSALLCGGVCFVSFVNSLPGKPYWSQVAFLAFLPACFLWMGTLMLRMKGEVSRLRRRVSALEQNKRPTPHTETRQDALAQRP